MYVIIKFNQDHMGTAYYSAGGIYTLRAEQADPIINAGIADEIKRVDSIQEAKDYFEKPVEVEKPKPKPRPKAKKK